eukprot:scaffold93239_cov30-Tisochrysis_lutea.AAC.1
MGSPSAEKNWEEAQNGVGVALCLCGRLEAGVFGQWALGLGALIPCLCPSLQSLALQMRGGRDVDDRGGTTASA